MKLSCLCDCIVNHIAFAVSLFVMTNVAFGGGRRHSCNYGYWLGKMQVRQICRFFNVIITLWNGLYSAWLFAKKAIKKPLLKM